MYKSSGQIKIRHGICEEKLTLFAYKVYLEHPTRKERMCFEAKPESYPFNLFEEYLEKQYG